MPQDTPSGPPASERVSPKRRKRGEFVAAAARFLASQEREVFLPRDLEGLVARNKSEWNAPSSLTVRRLLKTLEEETLLRRIHIPPIGDDASRYRPFTRYVWGPSSPFAIALSLKPGAYLSHASAVFIHGLTDQIPKTIYVNKEQSPKNASAGQLVQESIDRAFKNEPRESNYVFDAEGFRVTILSGKFTNRLEVTSLKSSDSIVDVTKLERTLIDITVRPTYAGGVSEVLRAYSAARDRVSVPTLLATLKRLDYTYPYHQAIGFYMERAGFRGEQLDKLRALPMGYNFYLTHKMHGPRLSDDWKVYFPEGL
jgi:predicted transcriptional regulator of viral defense system